jgi:FKBP-type peptidyl-prolyl cis-trans isomerase
MLTRQSKTKKLIAIISLLLLLSFSETQAQKKTATTSSVKTITKEDSLQYAMGIYVGKWIRDNGFTSFDAAHFMAGLEDVLRQQPRQFNDSTVAFLFSEQKKKVQLTIARNLEAKLFASIADTPNIKTLSGGIKYLVRKTGNGVRPAENDSVVISFKGLLVDGTVFEDTYSKQIAITTTPANLFPGLKQSLLAMPAGSVWQLFIPSALAYGDTGNTTTIPPGNALIMLVSLVDVKKKP